MFGLEESYRGIENKFDTQYMNLTTYEINENGAAIPMEFDCFKDGFYIPENLYIIGTMNDIDRSVESFDFALRRRFQWVNVKANEVMEYTLNSMLDEVSDDLVSNIINMNNKMTETIPQLTEEYHIGPAYFKEYNGEIEKLEEIFNNNIVSILKEYTRGRNKSDIANLIEVCRNTLFGNIENNSVNNDSEKGNE